MRRVARERGGFRPLFRGPNHAHAPPRPKRFPLAKIDLLASIFTVTRAAKRYRDLAHKLYLAGRYGLASHCRKRKDALYELKDRGIFQAVRVGRIAAVEACGNLTLYRGEGYCYHSFLHPLHFAGPVQGGIQKLIVEAKPKEAREPSQGRRGHPR